MKESLQEQLRRAHEQGRLPTSEYAKYPPEIRKRLIEQRSNIERYEWSVVGEAQIVNNDLTFGDTVLLEDESIVDMRADVVEISGEQTIVVHGQRQDGSRVRVIGEGKFFVTGEKNAEH